MRKMDPADVRADFAALVTERLAHFARLEARLRGTEHEKRDLSLLSETTLHAVYVAFECFLSDLFLAYINRDFSQYQSTMAARISDSVKTKFGVWAAGRLNFNAVKHIKVVDLESLLDPDNYNLTFKSSTDLRQKANDWIASPQRSAIVSMTTPDSRLIDTVHSIRNFIAHNSPSSKAKMNDALLTIVTGVGCPNTNLGRGPRKIQDAGAFLKSVNGGERRVQRFASRLGAIAAAL